MAVVTNIDDAGALEVTIGLWLSKCTEKNEVVLCLCILMDLKLMELIRLMEAMGARTLRDRQELHMCKLQRQECAWIASTVYDGALPIDCSGFTASAHEQERIRCQNT
jgi:hypothetical protein